MTTDEERTARQDRHLQALREFLVAELRDELDEARQEAESALAARDTRYYDICLERVEQLTLKLGEHQSLGRAPAPGGATAA